MKAYKRNYLTSIGAGEQDIVLCEVCRGVAVDIHHIEEKGMGGRKGADELENLVALCRSCHDTSHSNNKELTKGFLLEIARNRIERLKG